MSKEITEESTLSEILETEEGEEILLKHGIPCLGCPLMGAEASEISIEEVSNKYGLELEKIIADLNQDK